MDVITYNSSYQVCYSTVLRVSLLARGLKPDPISASISVSQVACSLHSFPPSRHLLSMARACCSGVDDCCLISFSMSAVISNFLATFCQLSFISAATLMAALSLQGSSWKCSSRGLLSAEVRISSQLLPMLVIYYIRSAIYTWLYIAVTHAHIHTSFYLFLLAITSFSRFLCTMYNYTVYVSVTRNSKQN